MDRGLVIWDWLIVGGFLAVMLAVGLYFARRAGKDIESFFVSSRSLPWYISGASMIATGFASDTPLWVTALIRKYGVYYIWQYWAPFIGGALAMVLFARLWRRMGVLTDIEFLERRYSGRTAGVLRFWCGATSALFFCPLVIGWVTKAMEVLSREALGLPPQYKVWTTALVVVVALGMCALSGLWGVVYTDFIQFLIATGGTIVLAVMSVRHVGGLDAMLEQLSQRPNITNIAPSIGSKIGQMSVWNAIGYFGLLWIMVATSGGYTAQRLLACKDTRHASLAMLMFTICYYALVAWPWIIVALCSVIMFPDLGPSVSHDAAYPRMLVTVLPIGMRGLLVAALLAAFISTVSTLFNWGSSYLVNDVYKRFLVRDAASHHYIWVARVATVGMAIAGGAIGYIAEDIQQLLAISYVLGTSSLVVVMMRWFWWRLNAVGDLAANIAAWSFAVLLLFVKAFDGPMGVLLGLGPDEEPFSSNQDLLGARMLLGILVTGTVAVVATYLSRPTDTERLKGFVRSARPFHFFWKPVIEQLEEPYYEYESLGRTIVSWLGAVLCVGSLLFGVGKLLLGSPALGLGCLAVFAVTLVWTVKRVYADFAAEQRKRGDVS